jgi:hypothetical protein
MPTIIRPTIVSIAVRSSWRIHIVTSEKISPAAVNNAAS